MENEVVNVEENFARELGQAFALSATATAGALAGCVVVVAVAAWIGEHRKTRTTETTQEQN